MNLNLSIVIVTYNCEGFISKMLDELILSLNNFEGYEILLMDNNSTDLTLLELKDKEGVVVIDNFVNNGFAKANNMLISLAKYDNILLLNPDVFGFSNSFWVSLMDRWDHINPLVICLLNKDLTYQDCVGGFVSFKRIFFNFFCKRKYSRITSPIIVEMGIMAFFLVSKSCLNSVGLISEDYHMYCEDMDWCFRAHKKGFPIIYDPTLSLIHWGGASSKTKWKEYEIKKIKYLTERIFIKKHYSFLHGNTLLLLNRIKILSCNLFILFSRK